MTTSTKVKQGDYIVSNCSLEGDDVSLSPGQILLVGIDIPVGFANVLLAEPADDPRASTVDAETGKRVRAEQQDTFAQTRVIASETPSMERHTSFEKADPLSDPASGQGENAEPGLSESRGDVESPALEPEHLTGVEGFGNDIQSEIERARAEEAEMRSDQGAEETATSPAAEQRETAVPKTRKKRVKPPADDDDKKEEDD